MRFLILGGTGYLGSKLARALVDRGHDIICTKRSQSDITRLAGYEEHITLIPASVDAVETAFVYGTVDWVLNMVCNYGRSTILYDTVIESNIVFPLTVLNLAVKYGVSNFLTIGTGLPDELNMYSFSKKQFSDFGKFYVENHKINFLNMRLEMFYGSDEPKDRFIPSCIIRMLLNEDICLTMGTQRRDIVSIYDVIEAILYVIAAGLKGFHEIPVGTGEAPTIRDILLYIKEETDSSSDLRFGVIPMRKNEPDCVADITKLHAMGYKCRYDWRQGIRKMIEEIKENEITH